MRMFIEKTPILPITHQLSVLTTPYNTHSHTAYIIPSPLSRRFHHSLTPSLTHSLTHYIPTSLTMSFTGKFVQRTWHLVDASSQTVGRLSTTIASLLKGKHKPTFSPNTDCGDVVVIVNAEKVTHYWALLTVTQLLLFFNK